MTNLIWRYSIGYGNYGGIVIAKNMSEATEKVSKKYNTKDYCVWAMKIDDYFDEENPDVLECYGL